MILGKDSKGRPKYYKKLFLQQFWVSPFVEGENGEWKDIPIKGAWNVPDEEVKETA